MSVRSSAVLAVFAIAACPFVVACPQEAVIGDASTGSDAGPDVNLFVDARGSGDMGPGDDAEPQIMDAEPDLDAEPDPDAEPPDADPAPDADVVVPFRLTSTAFAEGGTIPRENSCRGADTQPALAWEGTPAGTMSFAMVLIDDSIDYVHWVAYNMPAATTMLAASASDDGMLPQGTVEALAYCRQFCGPCPGNTHMYTFRLYALDAATVPFNHQTPIDAADLAQSFGPHQLGLATLTGTFTP